ncbi:MAG: 5-formyltetrahydrofolate cyclo-ligase [Prevotella sp.]|nr:5-formyltetrahydrofolate cyclo-ligase [Candidatus Prevotella equi]
MNKQQLRKYIRSQKLLHSKEECKQMSEEICRHLTSNVMLQKARIVVSYWPLPDEVDVTSVNDYLVAIGKTVLLPKVISETEMTLHRYEGMSSLQSGAYGILEPQGGEVELCEQEDIVAIVSGMAFDTSCHRLGRGKGYYDRFLSAHAYIYKIGVCYPFQNVDEVPADKHDVMMNEVLF